MSNVISNLTSAVLAIFTAEQNVQDKRSDAARTFKSAANDARKAEGKAFNFGTWCRNQAALAREALVDASGLAVEFRALDEKGRKEHAATHGKADSLAVLIRQYGSLTVRFSEMKRLYLLDKAGDHYASEFYAGRLSIAQAIELVSSQYSKVDGDDSTDAAEGSEGETTEGDASAQEKFRAALTMWAGKASKENWVADFANIMAEIAQTIVVAETK